MNRSAFLASIAAMIGVARAQAQDACVGKLPGFTVGLPECPPGNGMCPTCSTIADPFPHNIVRGQLKPYTQLIDCKHCRNAYFVDSIDPKDMPKGSR